MRSMPPPLGVTATIVNDGSGTPYRLALTSSSSGASNSFKITTSGGDGTIDSLLGYDPAGTQNLTQTLAAQNADLTVNGIAITSASNTVSEAIQGVTLTLKNITATPASLTVARDTTAINTAASGFVEAYNALASQIKSRSAYGTDGKDGRRVGWRRHLAHHAGPVARHFQYARKWRHPDLACPGWHFIPEGWFAAAGQQQA